jgi:hypothetical protein
LICSVAGTHVGIDSGSAEMARITLDGFIEAFAAYLIKRGRNMVRLNDPDVRDGLYRVYLFLDGFAGVDGAADKDLRRSIVNIRNVFRPSPIGSFDRFETLLRAKQVYLTDHPNPYYQDIVIKLPAEMADRIVAGLDDATSDLARDSVDRYLAAG